MPEETPLNHALPTLVFAADHAGFELKAYLKAACIAKGYSTEDTGCYDTNAVDYPLMVDQAVQAMQNQHSGPSNNADKKKEMPPVMGVFCCGSGVGVAIRANRYPFIRAVRAHERLSASLSRKHNNTNVICFGARFIAPEMAMDILETWLDTAFEGERHAQRVSQMDSLPVL
ncbi:MAG: RpiB/LacA/LacB family sugar-phosphate isomerase [Cyanobacteria bacterium P01_H01_bin.74]